MMEEFNHTADRNILNICIKMILVALMIVLFHKETFSQNLLQYVQPYSGTAPSTTSAALKHSEAGSEKIVLSSSSEIFHALLYFSASFFRFL